MHNIYNIIIQTHIHIRHCCIYYIHRLFMRQDWNSLKRINRIEVPILFISGCNDELIPREQMQKLINNSTNSNQRLVCEISKGQHNDTWFVGGTVYLQSIRHFTILSGYIWDIKKNIIVLNKEKLSNTIDDKSYLIKIDSNKILVISQDTNTFYWSNCTNKIEELQEISSKGLNVLKGGNISYSGFYNGVYWNTIPKIGAETNSIDVDTITNVYRLLRIPSYRYNEVTF